MEATPPPPPPPPSPPFPPPPPVPQAPRRGWWSRNWKWFVPTGCLSLFVLFLAFIGSILLLVFGAMKSSDVYKTALARARSDTRVRHALGPDIRDGMFPSGKTNVTGPSGEAELAITISGAKGKGTIYVIATKSAGEWHYSKLLVKTADGETIDLRQSGKSRDSEAEDKADDSRI